MVTVYKQNHVTIYWNHDLLSKAEEVIVPSPKNQKRKSEEIANNKYYRQDENSIATRDQQVN